MFGGDSDEEEDDDDEDTDIFAQATSSSKKKDDLLKKKPVDLAPKPAEPASAPKKEEPPPLKACLMIKIVEFNEETNAKKAYKEVMKVEMEAEAKNRIVKCIASANRFAFLIKEPQQNGEEHLVLYIYDLKATKYQGFINLTQNLGIPDLSKQQYDIIFSSGALKGCLTIFTKDTLYLIAENSRNGQPGKWSLIRK